MARQESIKAQLKRAAESLPKMETEYNASLHKQTISEELKLDIQSFCGHLRASLDYLAKDIVEKFCPNANPRDNLYFPITSDAVSFTTLMRRSYPDLATNCPDLYDFFESIQPYIKAENSWLSQFNKLNNENKHNDLVEQTRTETRTVKVIGKGGDSISWGPGITFGSGISVMGVPIDPRTQLPVQNNIVKTQIITWVDFRFNGIEVSALYLLRESLKQIETINTTVTQYL